MADKDGKSEREKRLAEALRRNLRRRKAPRPAREDAADTAQES